MDLTGQVALVTGGSKGLGRAFATALAKAGASVAITARSKAELTETAQVIHQTGTVFAYPADVTDHLSIKEMVRQVEKTLGPINLLINNAGIFQAFGSIAEIEPESWWKEMEVNLKGPFLLSHTILPNMIANGGGRIINIASGAGNSSIETISAYCVSKAALIRFSEILALETKSHHISVFAIDPGTVRTTMNDQLIASDQAQKHAPFVHQWMKNLYETGMDTPIEQSVQLVLRIASGEADVLSGCFLSVDDDLKNLSQQAQEIEEKEKLKLRLRV
jgi:NAD(P)-dependent dehydrogenase (short-subunit alcohol dehydrogenase family)